MTREEIREGIYDLVLAIRTEGIIRGKTKRFARSDADEILDYLHLKDVVREVGTRWYVSNGEYLNPLTDKPVRVVAVESLVEEC